MNELLRVYDLSECGKDGYPLAWHKGEPSIKELVRELAEHRCVRCNHPYRCGEQGSGEWSPCDEQCTHGGPVRALDRGDGGWRESPHAESVERMVRYTKVHARWRILTVHHLTGDKADCRWWNLAALCQRCHLQIQGKVRMEQVYPHEHSEWFKPYAAGYYAAVYLREELTRAEAEERLDELLALEAVA